MRLGNMQDNQTTKRKQGWKGAKVGEKFRNTWKKNIEYLLLSNYCAKNTIIFDPQIDPLCKKEDTEAEKHCSIQTVSKLD